MMKKITTKIRSAAGETIAETLVALLISALGLLMLAGAISTSTRLITQSKEKMTKYYVANQAVEMHTGASDTRKFTVVFTDGNMSVEPGAIPYGVDIYYYLNDTIGNYPVISYAIGDRSVSDGRD